MRRPSTEKGIEKAFEKEFRDSPSKQASLEGDAAIIVGIMRKWHGSKAHRQAALVLGWLEKHPVVNTEAQCVGRLLNSWYGDESLRVAIRVEEALR